MNIAHVSIYPPKGKKHAKTGGVASYTKNLVNNLSSTTQDKHFVIADSISGEDVEYCENGATVLRVFNRDYRFLWQIFKAVSANKPDVVHIQQELGLYGSVVTAYLLQWLILMLRMRTKVVVTLHGVVDLHDVDAGFVQENNSSMPPILVRMALRIIYIPLCFFAHQVIVHEEKFKQTLIKQYFGKGGKIQAIAHGVEALEVLDQVGARAKIQVPADKNVVLFMGYLTGYKGLDVLLEGFTEYVKQDPKAFLIIGAGKHPKLHDDAEYLREYARLVNKAAALLAPEQYIWHGFIEESDIGAYYCASNISMYPYTTQMSSSGPMAIALGYGKPFMASSAFAGVLEPELIFGDSAADLCVALASYFTDGGETLSSIVKDKRETLLWPTIAGLHMEVYKL